MSRAVGKPGHAGTEPPPWSPDPLVCEGSGTPKQTSITWPRYTKPNGTLPSYRSMGAPSLPQLCGWATEEKEEGTAWSLSHCLLGLCQALPPKTTPVTVQPGMYLPSCRNRESRGTLTSFLKRTQGDFRAPQKVGGLLTTQ